MVNALSAANAYRNQLKLQDEMPEISGIAANEAKPSFGQMVQDALQDAVQTQYQAENIKMESLTGKVELSDLVTAVTNAELTLNTVVAVRDRVINAYQEIIRMPI
ncbi:MAG: flagellar hook-basal body complex protein FliE [Rickettsiales bacterium]|jgi:flagellar hook-basal body complex protein FliE|nr:flagellar hook-basal body complex protein FliE [Rickettsiales bacterium]